MQAALLAVLSVPLLFAGDYDSLAANARQTVRIAMSRELLETLGDMSLGNATSLRLHSFTYDTDGTISEATLAALSDQVRGRAQNSIVDVRSRNPQQHVQAFAGAGTLTVIVAEARELTVIEIDGATPGELPALARHFGLSDLDTDAAVRTVSKHPKAAAKSAPRLDLGGLAKQLESRYGVRRESIPMWLVKPFAFRSGLDIAVWEHTTPEMQTTFHDAVQSAMPTGWVPFVEVTKPGERTSIWIAGTGNKAQILIASLERNEASLVKVRTRLDDWTHHRGSWAGKGK